VRTIRRWRADNDLIENNKTCRVASYYYTQRREPEKSFKPLKMLMKFEKFWNFSSTCQRAMDAIIEVLILF